MRNLVIVLLFALLFISQINTIIDIDLWWNLKTGQCIIENLDVPRTDIFSYTLKDRPWIDHEWLSQVIFYLVFSRFSWLGLNILKALLVSLSFLVLLFLNMSKYKKISYSSFFIMLGVLAFGYRSVLRPEIFSYLLLCASVYLLERGKGLFLLPMLQIIWVNLHGYFILGPILVFLYTVGEFFSGDKDKAKRFAKVFLWMILSCFINPYFYRGTLYPLRILMDVFTEQRLFMQHVHELMMPVRAGFGRFLFLWVFAILASVSFLVNIKGVKIRHVLVFTFGFIASYMAVRNIPIFIFLAMPIAALNLNEARLTKDIPERKMHIVIALVVCGLIYLFLSNRYYVFTNQSNLRKTESVFSRAFMPSGACNFLEDNNITGPMFNTLDFGPYIGYRFYPERRIFIDTRTELYRDDFYRLYRQAQNYPAVWRRLHKEYGFEIVLLRHLFGGTERLLKYLYRDRDWRLVYYDENSCIFLSTAPRNAALIDRFQLDFSDERPLDEDININTARFFEKIGEDAIAEKIYIKLLEKNPFFLEAGNNLASIYITTGRYDDAMELIQEFLGYYPMRAELYANMGTLNLRLGKKEQGLLMLEEASRLNPYLRKASYMLGIVYLESGDVERAERQFIKYLRLDPYDAEAHRILGDIYIKKGLLKKAESEYNEADALEMDVLEAVY